MELGSSVVECRTRTQGFESPFATVSKLGHFRSTPRRPSSLICINEYLAIISGENVSVQSLRVIAAWLECFQEKPSWCRNEQICQGQSVKRFERSNGLDAALYKTYLYLM